MWVSAARLADLEDRISILERRLDLHDVEMRMSIDDESVTIRDVLRCILRHLGVKLRWMPESCVLVKERGRRDP